MDDDGFTIDAFIRDGLDPENAFWNPNRQTLSFGVGGSNFRSLIPIFLTAGQRISLDLVSVPVWLIVLSDQ